MTIVNEEYYITFSPNKRKTAGGKTIAPYSFHPVKLNESISGIPFFHILNNISQYQDWLSKMAINYKPYADSFLLRLYNEAKD